MKKYDSYKDSGVEWLGEIPKNWEIKKIKYLGKILSGYSFKSDDFIDNDGCRVMKISNIQTMNIDWSDESFVPHSFYDKYSNFQIKKGDLVFALTRPIISTGIKASIVNSEEKILLNQRNAVLKPTNKLNVNWMYYLVFNPRFLNHFENLIDSTGQQPNISALDISNIPIPLPSIEEQTDITNYLNHKISQIDDLIAKKERLIQLLEEERTAVINQAVTKGLDPTVKMKDSGIEWLGEIPEHWEVAKFNLFILIRHGHQFMNYDFTEDGIKVIKITQLHKDGFLDLSKCSYVSNNQVENYQSILIKEHDILMCLTGGTIGKIIRVGEVNEPLLQNYRVGHFSSADIKKISNDFIFWLMSSESIISQIFFQMRETGQPNIGMEDFGRMRITIPPIIEQENIVKHLIKKTDEISKIITQSKQEIDLLKEYKTALISEVVTGKLDVREEVIK